METTSSLRRQLNLAMNSIINETRDIYANAISYTSRVLLDTQLLFRKNVNKDDFYLGYLTHKVYRYNQEKDTVESDIVMNMYTHSSKYTNLFPTFNLVNEFLGHVTSELTEENVKDLHLYDTGEDITVKSKYPDKKIQSFLYKHMKIMYDTVYKPNKKVKGYFDLVIESKKSPEFYPYNKFNELPPGYVFLNKAVKNNVRFDTGDLMLFADTRIAMDLTMDALIASKIRFDFRLMNKLVFSRLFRDSDLKYIQELYILYKLMQYPELFITNPSYYSETFDLVNDKTFRSTLSNILLRPYKLAFGVFALIDGFKNIINNKAINVDVSNDIFEKTLPASKYHLKHAYIPREIKLEVLTKFAEAHKDIFKLFAKLERWVRHYHQKYVLPMSIISITQDVMEDKIDFADDNGYLNIILTNLYTQDDDILFDFNVNHNDKEDILMISKQDDLDKIKQMMREVIDKNIDKIVNVYGIEFAASLSRVLIYAFAEGRMDEIQESSAVLSYMAYSLLIIKTITKTFLENMFKIIDKNKDKFSEHQLKQINDLRNFDYDSSLQKIDKYAKNIVNAKPSLIEGISIAKELKGINEILVEVFAHMIMLLSIMSVDKDGKYQDVISEIIACADKKTIIEHLKLEYKTVIPNINVSSGALLKSSELYEMFLKLIETYADATKSSIIKTNLYNKFISAFNYDKWARNLNEALNISNYADEIKRAFIRNTRFSSEVKYSLLQNLDLARIVNIFVDGLSIEGDIKASLKGNLIDIEMSTALFSVLLETLQPIRPFVVSLIVINALKDLQKDPMKFERILSSINEGLEEAPDSDAIRKILLDVVLSSFDKEIKNVDSKKVMDMFFNALKDIGLFNLAMVYFKTLEENIYALIQDRPIHKDKIRTAIGALFGLSHMAILASVMLDKEFKQSLKESNTLRSFLIAIPEDENYSQIRKMFASSMLVGLFKVEFEQSVFGFEFIKYQHELSDNSLFFKLATQVLNKMIDKYYNGDITSFTEAKLHKKLIEKTLNEVLDEDEFSKQRVIDKFDNIDIVNFTTKEKYELFKVLRETSLKFRKNIPENLLVSIGDNVLDIMSLEYIAKLPKDGAYKMIVDKLNEISKDIILLRDILKNIKIPLIDFEVKKDEDNDRIILQKKIEYKDLDSIVKDLTSYILDVIAKVGNNNEYALDLFVKTFVYHNTNSGARALNMLKNKLKIQGMRAYRNLMYQIIAILNMLLIVKDVETRINELYFIILNKLKVIKNILVENIGNVLYTDDESIELDNIVRKAVKNHYNDILGYIVIGDE